MKQVANFPNYYVTICGKVWSQNRKRFLVGGDDKYGYPQWVACNVGERKTLKIHRQVALAYLPNPDNLPVINHKNGDKRDNRVNNLEWCTFSHNTKEAHRLGLIDQRGDRNPSATYSHELVEEFLRSFDDTVTIVEHCKNFGIKYGSGYAFIRGLRRQGTFND